LFAGRETFQYLGVAGRRSLRRQKILGMLMPMQSVACSRLSQVIYLDLVKSDLGVEASTRWNMPFSHPWLADVFSA
jgi:hypothetical protein